MKKLKIICITLVFCLTVTSLFGCAKENEQKVYGDFIYTIVYYDEKGVSVKEEKSVHSFVRILGLSDVGKEKEIIVFPEYIEGLKVEELGRNIAWIGSHGIIESSKLKKLFFPYNLSISSDAIQDSVNLEGVFILEHIIPEYYIATGLSIYLTSNHYSNSNLTNFYGSDGYSNYYFSNVSYYYNYENAPNDGYYWIDNYNYGEKIEYIPEQPIRDRYTFGGWYKDPECVDAWNFEIDALPQTQYDEQEKEIYQETKLYAKWINN